MKLEKIIKGLIFLGFLALVHIEFFYPHSFWMSLFLTGLHGLTFSLGALLFLSIQTVTGARWDKEIRAVPEILTQSFWIFAPIVLVSFFFASNEMHDWIQRTHTHGTLASFTERWLAKPQVYIRALLYMIVWGFFVSRAKEFSKNENTKIKYSACFLIVFAFSFSLASVDWLASVEPHWSSTIFAPYIFSGLYLSALSAIAIFLIVLRRMKSSLVQATPQQFHDLGKFIFGFSLFWAYLWYCQYMLIWYVNLPEEISYYSQRHSGGWAVLSFTNVGLNWIIPFLILLPQWTKRSEKVLLRISLIVLAGHWLDLYIILMPRFARTDLWFGVVEGALFIGTLALLALNFLYHARKKGILELEKI